MSDSSFLAPYTPSLAHRPYLPLNPSHPDTYISRILEVADVSVVACQEKTKANRNWAPDYFNTIEFSLDLLLTLAQTNSQDQQHATIDEDALAYVIFTSGSTGAPKGVQISHRGAANTCLDINARFGITDTDSIFAISSLSFDLSVYDIFGMLMAGGTAVICKPEGTRDPDYWWAQLEAHNVTVWNTVPSMFEMLLEGQPRRTCKPLKTVLVSGDAFRMEVADRIINTFPDLHLIVLGGATEASIWSNYHVVTPRSIEQGTTLVPYGQGLSNQVLYVLDDLLDNRPVGALGEIFIGGIGVAIGYMGNANLTTRKFITHSRFGRIYATGDFGRYLQNGEIEIVGRSDDLVKIGGNRVELPFIEQIIGQHESIRNAAAMVNEHGQLGLFFVPLEEHTVVHEEELRAFAAANLPDYMHPTCWSRLNSLPLSPNGKLDRKALKLRSFDKSAHSIGPTASHNTDREVPRVMSQVASCHEKGEVPCVMSQVASCHEKGRSQKSAGLEWVRPVTGASTALRSPF